MSAELAGRIRDTAALIRADIKADIEVLERSPFNGQTVGLAFGHLAAQVDALAGMVAALADAVLAPTPKENP